MKLPCSTTSTSHQPRQGRGVLEDPVQGDSGSALIELAVSISVLFSFLFTFMQLCILFYTRDMIAECAREGTRYAMVRGATCPNASNPTCMATAAQVNSYVSSLGWPNLAGGTMRVSSSYPDGDEAVGHRVVVSVTYSMTTGMAFVPRQALTLTSSSQAYIIQ